MKSYLKLVNFELGRFMKIYLVLIGLTIISQMLGVIVVSKNYLSRANEAIYEEQLSIQSFIEQFGTMSFNNIATTLWFLGPIAICIVSLLIYTLFIWYRDWFGKNTFIYRLLMLPTARMNVFLAKASAIFLMVLGLIALQFLLLPIESKILQWMVPIDLRTDMSITEMVRAFDRIVAFIFPASFTEFVINYGIGLVAVFVVFTMIMFERCYRLKGIVIGTIYGALSVFVFLLPIIVQEFLLYQYFYPIELLILLGVTGIVVTASSLAVSNFLLNQKIRV